MPLALWALLLLLSGCSSETRSTGESGGESRGTSSQAATSVAANKAATKSVAWVLMKQKAGLAQASAVRDWKARGTAVHGELTRTAATSQASINSFLAQRGAKFKSFWIVNAVRVEADQATIDALAKRSDVAKVLPDRTFSIPPIQKGTGAVGVNATEWGLDNIRAPEAWLAFGSRGEGIVVANIDTGVQFDHPAVQRQYRGSVGGGTVDHNYNWFDPAGICGGTPCDNAGHGTHTMGTMVGDDGDPGVNQVGVAPHSRWMAAKGCEDFGCSLGSLLSSAQWVLAPTDLNGNNPRPDLRPNIVNNSWGSSASDPFFQDAVRSWVAAGMFPSFSAGNAGPGCGSVGSPGDYPEAYGVAAYDQSNQIAFFSSRGPSFTGAGKPNIAAPGVNVRSSVPGNSYDFFSGTSMAAPHLSGAVALLWSAAPSLVGDIAGTRALLDQTAVDTNDTSCGGLPENNFVWGEGRLDVFMAVENAPRGPTGYLAGTVTAQAGGAPLAGAKVIAHSSSGPDRSVLTGADGTYSLRLSVGSYDVSTQLFGFLPGTAIADVTDGATTTQDFALAPAPAFSLSGTVRDSGGAPVAGAAVTIQGTPIAPAVTDAAGQYSFASVPAGDYSVNASAGHCFADSLVPLTLSANATLDFTLLLRRDSFGYSCTSAPFSYISASTNLNQFGDDILAPVTLPFPFTYYGQTYTSANVSSNGVLQFGAPSTSYFNTPIPDAFPPNASIYGFWDDLYVDGTGAMYTEVLGAAPNRKFVVEWRDVALLYDTSQRVSFEIVIYETGQILLQYASGSTSAQRGDSATIGIEDQDGLVGLQYSYNQDAVPAGTAIYYTQPPSGFVTGVVTDANDGTPVKGATVRALAGNAQIRATATDALGAYRLQVPVGSYTVEASFSRYVSQQRTVAVADGQFVTANFALPSARATLTPAFVQLLMPAQQTRTRTLTLGNTGSASMDWTLAESGGARQTTVATARLPRNPSANLNARDTRTLFGGTTPPAKGWTPNAAGDVLASFTPTGLGLAWGVGYTSNVWLSDVFGLTNTEFTTAGSPTGLTWPTSWVSAFPGDMAYDPSRNLVCQVNVGGDNGIYCWDPATGVVGGSITGSFAWTGTSQRGLAYKADDDTFYIGGWNSATIYHVKGLSYPDAGTVLDSCIPSDGNISGLAYNAAVGVLWVATNSTTDTIYELNPVDCTVLATLPHPTPGFNGGGLDMDDLGNLWAIGQSPNRAYLIDSGVPSFSDVPWMSVTPTSGTIAPGGSRALTMTVDTTGLTPGIYLASLYVRPSSGRETLLRVPVSLVVTAYQQSANAGGAVYSDTLGDTWAADRAYTAGSWGYVQKGKALSTTKNITGTSDPRLFQSQRINPYAYRFDQVPNGIYQVDLKFAEIDNAKVGKRLFDVIAENTLLLPAHDIRYEVGANAADSHVFFVEVTDGQMDLRFVPRAGFDNPVVNALRVTHRPDR